ncbi:PepSY-associated TM helix domain-containing protein [Undibacterium sp. Di26W]|uniref:PepSY-associated TM helix domain-containing protein n=1 Tax=Undibacterium sp. Di26W TaxID=3413035 RepID=UPI003BF0DE92
MLSKSVRAVLLRLHLWLALVFGSVFVVLGLTGSIISWMPELDHLLNPSLFKSTHTASNAERVTPAMVQAAVDMLQADDHNGRYGRYGRPRQVMIPASTAEVFVAWYPPTPQDRSIFGQNWSRQVMLDPMTMAVTGERNWGEYGLSPALLIPTIYHLHRYMLLGETGKTVIAVCGLMLILMSVSGLFLWLPKPAWKALRQALTVNFSASAMAVNFRLHRMSGFFALPVFLLLGFSGTYFNQPRWIVPVISTVLPVTGTRETGNANKPAEQVISVAQAMQYAQDVFPQARITRLGLPSSTATAYEIRLRQATEIHRGDGASRISVDAESGRILRVIDPLRGQSGDRLLTWLFPLHSGTAFGTVGRIFISCFGLMPLILMVTGWRMWRKRMT